MGLLFLAVPISSYFRISHERATLIDDLTRRARVIGQSLAPAALRLLKNPPNGDEEDLAERLSGQGRTMGIVLCDLHHSMVARSAALAELVDCSDLAEEDFSSDQHGSKILDEKNGQTLHHFTLPLTDKNQVFLGTLTIVHEASYINRRIQSLVTWGTFTFAALAFFISALTYFLSRRFFQHSVKQFIAWMKNAKESDVLTPPTNSLLKPVAREVEKLSAHLRSARETAHEVAQAHRSGDLWTSAKLKAHALSLLGNRTLIVVSNREPYMHIKEQGQKKVIVPAGGVVTALDPMLRATSGLWVAHGAGDADRESADREGKILVPPAAPVYTLKRVWLSKEDEQGYYYGFSNEALWPLCHLTHHRPHFEEKDWASYCKVNQLFAENVCAELGKDTPFVLIQDYHFTVLPQLIRNKRSDAVVGLFWHIPWPTVDVFQVCPWKREILEGMLGANFIGFHLQSYCNNFLETVNNLLPVRIDWERSAILHEKGTTFVKPFPISIEPWSEKVSTQNDAFEKKAIALREEFELRDTRVVVSVDRLDYTKGIPERLGAIERFFEKYPEYLGKVTFVQLASPSRTHIPRYRELAKEVEGAVDQMNWKYGTQTWKPVLFLKAHHNGAAVYTFMRLADACIVSSLADGMNLVAKEFVAAREQNDGVLILSEFAGVARQFQEALQFNPYARADFAETIHVALEMPKEEQIRRMTRLKMLVTENNVYKWAADLVTEMVHVAEETS